MVEARWRWTLFSFVLAFTGDWLLFGTLYWVISNVHGDLVDEHLPPNQNTTNWTPCIENIHSFVSTFLFSVEVHTTVAYGDRSITLECPQAIFIMCLQCIVSSVFQAFMVGILFAKLTRPKSRTQTILFSKIAAVNMRDENLNLIFRVGDIRKSRILNIKAKAFQLKHDMGHPFSDEVEQTELKLETIECESFFFLWPVSFVHIIDQDSPLHTVSAADLLCSKMEILVIFEGIIESTGQPIQARSSYTETEVLWGHRFVPMVKYDQEKKGYDVDFSKLSNTVHVDTPLCSASELDSLVNSMICSNTLNIYKNTLQNSKKNVKRSKAADPAINGYLL